MASGTFVYYCSGHGYGHATRVSAFTCHLLNLPSDRRPIIHIVSSAPQQVFADSISLGAHYRYAEIDPVIVQPLAYSVDRRLSLQVLKAFLSRKEQLLQAEVNWLTSVNARCVLSDAAFLGCMAAKHAGIPSALVTNFTFDSVYSYLSTTFTDQSSKLFDAFLPDKPVAEAELKPLVEHIHAGYRCADLLLLLPGNIPIPSFPEEPSLPATHWVDPTTGRFRLDIVDRLSSDNASELLHPIPFPSSSPLSSKLIPRRIKHAPLLVRPCTDAYTSSGRSRILQSVGVPTKLHDTTKTKILLVSFGGQIFRSPSRSSSRKNSLSTAMDSLPGLGIVTEELSDLASHDEANLRAQLKALGISRLPQIEPPSTPVARARYEDLQPVTSPRFATSSHIWVPGAPPAVKTPSFATESPSLPSIATLPPTPKIVQQFEDDCGYQLLPDESWIAIVCGVTKEQWRAQDNSELPENFYIAPRTIYMPDLTAVSDVLLGKLGYGTVSECVDARTPFVYVSRPLFVEEHGLRLLLEKEGVGLELPREEYEAGDWAQVVHEAYERGKDMKVKHRKAGGYNQRQDQAREMAASFVDWVDECWSNT